MKFWLRHPDGSEAEVELGPGSVLGREKSCHLVLDDARCSRRHAVLEADGLTIRDTQSANGIFVNGRKVETAVLKAGDLVRLGDTEMTVRQLITDRIATIGENIRVRRFTRYALGEEQ